MLESLPFDVATLASGARLANLGILAHTDALAHLASLDTLGDNRLPVRRLSPPPRACWGLAASKG
ncbi:MAG: hypothetical protein KIS91_02215 [Anaerolineae bacterium]|nr:hypothetical protein [Anaerolineae bacterium]